VEQLFDVLRRLQQALSAAGIEYRVVGGMAAFFHVSDRDPLRARLTRDVDVAVRRSELRQIIEAVRPAGFEFRHVAGVDLLVDRTQEKLRSAIHFVFSGERVFPGDLEPVPVMGEATLTEEGFPLLPVSDLLRMKLTSFRLKDQVHIQDLDGVGLITPEIEATLSPPLLERLRQVRATR
jgi:hypothetical protein